MRIALFSTSWFDFYVLELVKALAPNHELVVFVDQHDEVITGELGSLVPIVRIPWYATRKRPADNMLSLARILKVLQSFSPEIVHFQEHDPRFPLLLPFIRRYGVVLDLHNVEPLPGVEHPLRDRFRDLTHSKLDAFVVHGASMIAAMRRRYKTTASSLYSIPFGRFSAFGGGQTERSEDDVPRVLFFGRIEPYKGIRTLVEAEPLIAKSFGRPFNIQIVGDGDLSGYFPDGPSPCRYEIVNERVKDPSPYFRQSDVVVMPYHEASVSGVTPVAYAHEKPVIVSDVGSLAESVSPGCTGLVVPPRNPSALAGAVVRLLADPPLCRAMGIAGRQLLDGPLAWSANIQQVEKAYQHAVTERGRRRTPR